MVLILDLQFSLFTMSIFVLRLGHLMNDHIDFHQFYDIMVAEVMT
jgi:hypothetical protein